ncbi:hypothetical protein [Ruixingdingia sedimenti]|uniref:O-antigen ligase like membrane protein n=1 Tax=Ruixingdingia sedimenti TaxID=3073604 RepID=A0ABU1F9W5_9RHOB|nr:hypothetical protein [Xinfangfangia sp. LG-4]MDR5653674.1 hypothetical protein [Xinfangfangia sp. LG-4]
MPNTLAYLMLLVWPIVTLAMFRRMAAERAVIWSVLGGYLLLPPVAAFNAPVIPALDKAVIPNLSAWACCVFVLRARVPLVPATGAGRVLMALFVISPLATAMTNGDPIRFVQGGLPGIGLYDAAGMMVRQFFLLIPFFLAQRFVNTPQAMRELVLALVVAGLLYSLPMLVEVRLSPQINVWVYGFFQHSFEQMMRYGGFRPIVFLEHGLWVAFFGFMAVVAAFARWRQGGAEGRFGRMVAAFYLLAVLILCKSMGVLIMAAFLLPVVLVFGPRAQVRLALVLVAIAVLYPLLRGAGLVPLDWVMEQVGALDAERAHSLRFRVMNEELLLDRANERALFGWGSWGRNLLHDPWDGKLVTIPDGRWIIVMGVYGWTGYIVEFGLLGLPVLLLARRRDGVEPAAATVALLLAANMVDMLPNATLIPFTWLMAGALTGYAVNRAPVAAAEAPAAPPRAPPRARTIL